MGCCNKVRDGRPIGRARYFGGILLLGTTQVGSLAALQLLAVPFPHYRKLLPFYRRYAKDTLMSVIRQERINVGQVDEQECDPECDWQPPEEATG